VRFWILDDRAPIVLRRIAAELVTLIAEGLVRADHEGRSSESVGRAAALSDGVSM
jgi:hypothetical protein